MGLSLRQITAVTQPILKVSTHKFLDFPWVCTLGNLPYHHQKAWEIKNTSGEALFGGVYGVIFWSSIVLCDDMW